MDDVTAKVRGGETTQPRLDFQEHLADLEAQGLLIRIDRPIDKDTELHPLVRWQFVGGIRRRRSPRVSLHQRGRREGPRYDMPVAVGALAASPRIYAVGMGKSVEEIGKHVDAGDRAADSADQTRRSRGARRSSSPATI